MKQVEISVASRETPKVLPHSWTYIGYDECNYTTTPEGMQLLKDFAALSDGPYYVRVHHLLCTGNCGYGFYKWGSTNVYREKEDGTPVYDYTVVDKIMDTMLACGVKPFFEIGFMPLDLVSPKYRDGEDWWGFYNQYQREFWSTPPKDYRKWYDLILNLTNHLLDRYGLEEVKSWYFEMWNEPDIFYWKGSHEEFCELYDYTEAAIHAACPDLQFGGPATTGPFPGSKSEEYLDKFFDHVKNGKNYCTGEKGTRLDYVTIHTKGGGYAFNPWEGKKCPSVERLLEQVRTGIQVMEKYGYGSRPLILSEADPDGWAAGGKFDNPNMQFRNTEYYATYVASAYVRLAELGEQTGVDIRPVAWAFLFPGERCFEGTRTFTTQGIHKAVFQTMEALSKLGGNWLETRVEESGEENADGVCALAAESASGAQILVCRHYDDWEACEEAELTLRVRRPVQSARFYLIDCDHSNPVAEWVRLGEPEFPAGDVYSAIQKKGALEEVHLEGKLEEGVWTLKTTLKPHAVLLAELN